MQRVRFIPNPNSFQISLKKVRENKRILKTIFEAVTLEEVLRFRLVSKNWNNIICKGSNSPLAQKAFMIVKSSPNFNSEKSSTNVLQTPSSTANQNNRNDLFNAQLNKNTLVTYYEFPNYKFSNIDIRGSEMQEFFKTRGNFIQHLILDSCIISYNKFLKTLNCCQNLRILHLIKINHIQHKESKKSEDPNCLALTRLQNLRIEAIDENSTAGIYTRSNHNIVDSIILDYKLINHLIIQNQLLQTIEIAGFGYGAMVQVLSILGKDKIHQNLTSLKFQRISTPFQPSYLYIFMQKLKHLKLRILELSFTNFARENIDFTDIQIPMQLLMRRDPEGNRQEYDEQEFIDYSIWSILAHHSQTLEELYLSNIGVSEHIFLANNGWMYLPKLKILKLHETKIVEVPKNPEQIFGKFNTMELSITKENVVLKEEIKIHGLQNFTKQEEIVLIILLFGLILSLSYIFGYSFGWLLGLVCCLLILTVYGRFRRIPKKKNE